MVEAPSTKRVKSGGNRCPHSSVTDAKILLSQKGTIIDVDADGSCGYHAVLMILVLKGLPLGLSITDFQKSLWKYYQEHKSEFVVSAIDGSDSDFLCLDDGAPAYAWGNHAKMIRRGKHQNTVRLQYYQNEVVNGIWRDYADYTGFVDRSHWMDSAHVLPIIVHKYKLPSILLHTSHPTLDGSLVFSSSVYSYSNDTGCVYINMEDGLFQDRNENDTACLLLFKSIGHYMVLKKDISLVQPVR